jgi:1-acyl-sn-glycerol-3-phosphate acyltransferase
VNAIATSADESGSPVAEPRRDSWMMRWFTRYSRRYIARHFDAVRVQGWENVRIDPDVPFILYFNHASWWDPLAAIALTNEFIPERSFVAPIDSAMLERYAILRRLGCFFGVEQGTARGARQFLRGSRSVLACPGAALAVTPQGHFADVRQRPAGLAPGLASLLSRVRGRVQVLPLAVEYAFWNERTPNVFARFGAQFSGESGWTDTEWAAALDSRLVETQDALASSVIRRDPAEFRTLLRGRAGIGGVYDTFRNFVARVRGKKFDPRHGG